MTASAVELLGQPRRRAPRITPEIREEMRQRELKAQRQPETSVAPKTLNRTEKYVFRTRVRTVRGLVHYIDVRPEGLDEDDAAVRHRLKRWDFHHKDDAKKYGKDWPALVQRVYDKIGGPKLEFVPIYHAFECFYATNDDDIAAYIRHFMARGIGEFKDVYEQSPRIKWVVGDGDATKSFPSTQMGAQMAQEYAASLGVTTLELLPDQEE